MIGSSRSESCTESRERWERDGSREGFLERWSFNNGFGGSVGNESESFGRMGRSGEF